MTAPRTSTGNAEVLPLIEERLADLRKANETFRGMSWDRSSDIHRNDREIRWLIDLRTLLLRPAKHKLDPATVEACAKFVEQHQETIRETSDGSERYLAPRKVGNLMGLAYVAGIKRLALPSPTPEGPLAALLLEYARDLRRNSSGGDDADYPWEWAKATADYLETLIKRAECAADQPLICAQTTQGIARLSASEVACYRWPGDTAEHRAMRAAFCDGAAHIASAQQIPGSSADATCYLERSAVRQILIGHADENLWLTELILSDLDALPIFTTADFDRLLPTTLPADVIAAVVGGGITSEQVTKVWGLVKAALELRDMAGPAIASTSLGTEPSAPAVPPPDWKQDQAETSRIPRKPETST